MGTIIERKSKIGGKRYTAQIRMKHQGAIVVNEVKTFAQRRFAVAWLKRQETRDAFRCTWSFSTRSSGAIVSGLHLSSL